MFIPFSTPVRHGSMKLTAKEKAARNANQVAKLARFQAHADLVAETVLPRINGSMTWEERFEAFKAAEAELGKVATGGEELFTGGWAPMFRQGALNRIRAVA
jgi:hypothetical protein